MAEEKKNRSTALEYNFTAAASATATLKTK